METEYMQKKFDELYDSIVKSGDTKKMERLGSMVKRVMRWLINYEPELAELALDMLTDKTAGTADGKGGYRNELTSEEAKQIVAQMQPRPSWTMDGLAASLQTLNLPTDQPPYFNTHALLTTMLMIQSDEGETLKKLLRASERDERLLSAVYQLAVDRLKDEDGKFNIRKYFGLTDKK